METDLDSLLRLIGQQTVELQLLRNKNQQLENDLRKSRAEAIIAKAAEKPPEEA